MTKQVQIEIKGLHTMTEDEGQEELTSICKGEYFNRNGSQYILFEEEDEEAKTVTRSKLKIKNRVVELKREGNVTTELCFEKGRVHSTMYQTPFGAMLLSVTTQELSLSETPDRIELRIEYQISLDDKYIADNNLSVVIRSLESVL